MPDEILSSSFATDITDVGHTGTGRTLDIYDQVVKIDISEIVSELEPDRAPFLRFLDVTGQKQDFNGPQKFEWLEIDQKTLVTTMDGAAGVVGSAVSTNLVVAGSHNFQPGDVLRITALTAGANYSLTERVLVTTKTNATTYVVTRGAFGSTARSFFAAADEVMIDGNSHSENSTYANPDSVEPTYYWNYGENFKDSVNISGRMLAALTRGEVGSIDAQLKWQLAFHKEKIDSAAFFSQRGISGTRTTTGGLEWFVDTYASSDNYIDATSDTFNKAWLDNHASDFFHYGSNKKIAIVGGQTFSKIGTFLDDIWRVNDQASKKLGYKVMDYECNHGTLHFIRSKTLDRSAYYSKYLFIADPEFVKKRPMKGRDTHIRMNVQDPGVDGRVHSIETDVGYEFRNPNAHFCVQNLNNAIS